MPHSPAPVHRTGVGLPRGRAPQSSRLLPPVAPRGPALPRLAARLRHASPGAARSTQHRTQPLRMTTMPQSKKTTWTRGTIPGKTESSTLREVSSSAKGSLTGPGEAERGELSSPSHPLLANTARVVPVATARSHRRGRSRRSFSAVPGRRRLAATAWSDSASGSLGAPEDDRVLPARHPGDRAPSSQARGSDHPDGAAAYGQEREGAARVVRPGARASIQV
jgi:hypothetical protein